MRYQGENVLQHFKQTGDTQLVQALAPEAGKL